MTLQFMFVHAFAHAQTDAYRLGPMDEIRLKVVDWREEEGRYEVWEAVSGNFVIAADGAISVPLAGQIAAAGLTPSELEVKVSEALQGKVRAAEAPSTAVEVVTYQPIYVIGDVEQPGPHPFSPGLTVSQGFALAGGAIAARGDTADQQATIRNVSRLRGLNRQIARLRAREVRLKAEVDDLEKVEFPDTIRHPDGAASTKQMLSEEVAIFEARRIAIDRELETLAELKDLLRTEISILDEKLVKQGRQLELIGQTVAGMEQLVEKGLARTPRLAEAQRLLIDLETKELDLQTGVFRAKRRLSEAERDETEVRAKRSTDATAELQRVRAEIEQLMNETTMSKELLLEAGSLGPEEETDVVLSFTITRSTSSGQDRFPAVRATTLYPGDVLEVTRSLIDSSNAVTAQSN
ncbi:polysaccharide biosynthesis/export family protein [Rhodobacteraceae bacterium NNCM2]|nr:polysaccharide biosynthesis/export family protein [Coraliihabitans acroporae]